MSSNLIAAAFMGLLEGLTEFLPVSSTGHLLLLERLIGFQGPPGHVFEVVIQFGAILAVMLLYWRRLWQLACDLPRDRDARQFTLAVLLAFFPAAFIGAMGHGFIKAVLFNPIIVAIALIVGGLLILLIEKKAPPPTITAADKIKPLTALKIGLCQCVAIIPGVSRSGATIMGALLLRVERKAATEFSFFLAMPTMLGASSYDLYKNYHELSGSDFGLIAIGFIAAFLTALAVVRLLVDFIGRHGFAPFAWYRIVVGSAALFWLLLG
jgi:undecaprenyl-diphosphatase